MRYRPGASLWRAAISRPAWDSQGQFGRVDLDRGTPFVQLRLSQLVERLNLIVPIQSEACQVAHRNETWECVQQVKESSVIIIGQAVLARMKHDARCSMRPEPR